MERDGSAEIKSGSDGLMYLDLVFLNLLWDRQVSGGCDVLMEVGSWISVRVLQLDGARCKIVCESGPVLRNGAGLCRVRPAEVEWLELGPDLPHTDTFRHGI